MSIISRKEEERNEKIIRGLMKLPPNRRCINCNSLGPQYVCTNFWTFVCVTCSGIHREFTHRVKSVSMSKFTSQEVEALQEGGNQRARESFLKDWDPREQRLPDNSNVDKVRDFIKNVYVDKKFFASKASGKPPRDTLVNNRFHEDEIRRASSYHSYSQSPPYDYQYEERRYGKQAPALTKKPGSDRGMFRILSTSRLSDHVQEDRFANEGTNGGDLFRSGTQSPPCLSHSSSSGKLDGMDLFNAPNPPQSATSAPSTEPGKSGGLDLFELLAASSASTEPTLSVNQEVKSFEPFLDLLTETLNDKSTDMTQKNEGWATFDTPSSSSWNGGVHDIQAPVNLKNNNQSWSSFEESTTPFESIYTKSSVEVPVQDPLVADPFLAWGISEDGVQSHGLDTKSCNPFDLPSEADHEFGNMSFDMSYMQSALPNHNMSSPWFSESAAIPFTPGASQDSLAFIAGQAPSLQLPSIQTQGPVATIGGNPFA